jgi:hypothetical protein
MFQIKLFIYSLKFISNLAATLRSAAVKSQQTAGSYLMLDRNIATAAQY